MTNKVIPTPVFERKFKRLSKKFSSLASEIENLENLLVEKPESGISLGANIYKIRLANKDKGKGKSGGFRVVTYLVYKKENSLIFTLSLFSISLKKVLSINRNL